MPPEESPGEVLPENPGADAAIVAILQSADQSGKVSFGEEDIRPLVRALGHTDPVVRKHAARALAQHPDPRAGVAFAPSYNHFDPVVRGYAAKRVAREHLERFVPCLVKNPVSRFAKRKAEGPVTDLPDLIDMMQNGLYQDRRAAIRILVRLHGYRALPALAGALEESSKRPTVDFRPYLTELEVLPAFSEFHDRSSAGPLLLHLQDDRPLFRAAALYLLAALRESRALPSAVRLLEDPSFEARRGAVALLGSLSDSPALPALIGALKDPDSRVVRAAIAALGEFPDPAVVAALIPFLGAIGTSEHAVRSLARIAPAAPGDVLAAARSGDPRVRAGAVEVLQSCTDQPCLDVLAAALSDPDPAVVNAALPAFERVSIPESTEALVRLGASRGKGIDQRRLIAALVASRDPRIAPILARQIHWMDLAESNMAKRAFESDRIEVGTLEDFTHTLPALERTDDAVVQWMIRTSRKLGPDTLPLIRNAVKDPALAKGAAKVLLGLGYKMKDAGDREILEALYGRSKKKEDVQKYRALESLLPQAPEQPAAVDEETVRGLVATFLDRDNPGSEKAGADLVRLGHPAFRPLAEALESPAVDIPARQRIATLLGTFHDTLPYDVLLPFLQDPRSGLRAAAAYALAGLRDERAVDPLAALLADQNTGVRFAAIAALSAIDSERSVKALLPCLYDGSFSLVVRACQALGELEYPVAIPPLIGVLTHPEAPVRSGAAAALQRLSRQSREPLITQAENPNPLVRAGVITGLQNCTDRRSRDACIRALHDPDAGVREAAAAAFDRVWDPAALDHLVLLCDDPSGEVRYLVACALAYSRDPRGASALALMSGDRDERIVRIAQAVSPQNLGKTETLADARKLIPLLAYERFRTEEVADRFIRTGPAILPDLLAALRGPDAALALGASSVLSSMGRALCDHVAADLIALLSDPDETARERAVDTLAGIGGPARPLLMKALESDDPLVWQELIGVLDRIGGT